MRSYVWPVLVLAVWLWAAGASCADAPDWNKPVNIDVRGGTLGDLIGQLSRQAGVSLQPSRNLCGQNQELWKEPLYLQARGITVRQAVEWSARALSCRYRYMGGNAAEGFRVWLDNSYSWVERGDVGMVLSNVEALLDGVYGVPDLDRQLGEIFKAITLFDNTYYFRLEEHGEEVKLVAALPGALKPLLDGGRGLLEERGSSVSAQAARPVDKPERDLVVRLARKVMAAYRQRPLNEVAADLAAQGGVFIGFDQAHFRGGRLPLVTLDKGEMLLREAIEALGKQVGLLGIEISLPGGIWLSRRPADWTRQAGREFVWGDTAQARAYYVGDFKEGLNGQLLANQVRQRVCPDAWLDPAASVTYHPPSGNLLVIASPAMQQEVYFALARLRQQGLSAPAQPPAVPGPGSGGGGMHPPAGGR